MEGTNNGTSEDLRRPRQYHQALAYSLSHASIRFIGQRRFRNRVFGKASPGPSVQEVEARCTVTGYCSIVANGRRILPVPRRSKQERGHKNAGQGPLLPKPL